MVARKVAKQNDASATSQITFVVLAVNVYHVKTYQSQTCSQSAHVSTSQIPSLCTNQTTNNIESSITDMSSTESHVVFEKGVSDSESESDGDSDSEEFEDAYDAYDFDNLDQIDTSKKLKADDLSCACASDTESDLSEIESY